MDFFCNSYRGATNPEFHHPIRKQIDSGNVAKLRKAWQYGISSDAAGPSSATQGPPATEAVPIMVDGMLYTPTVNHTIVALEPESGEEIWKYDLSKANATLRGVTYWPGDKDNPPAILAGTSEGRLIALNAKTGKLVPGFGKEGIVDLRAGVTDKFPSALYHMSSPGVIYRNLIITGAQGKEDDAREENGCNNPHRNLHISRT